MKIFAGDFKFKALVFAIAILQAAAWNAWNRAELHDRPGTLRQGVTVRTADDASYLRPPQKFIKTGAWRENSSGLNRYYLRSPGYGLIALPLFWIAGSASLALTLLCIVQLLVFGIAAVLFRQTLHMLELNASVVWLFTAFAFFSPWLVGFLNYTLTEAITPQWLVAGLFLAVYDRKRAGRYTLPVMALWLGLGFLTRPVLLPFGLLLLPAILQRWTKGKWLQLAFFTVLAVAPWLMWTARNYGIAGKIPSVHPIYDNTASSVFRSPHRSLTSVYKVWNANPAVFHNHVNRLWNAARADTGSFSVARRIASEWPGRIVKDAGMRKMVINSLEAFRRSAVELNRRVKRGEDINGLLRNEKKAIWRLDRLRGELVKDFPLDMWLFTPVKSLKRMGVQSNLNLYLFQSKLRGYLLTGLLKAALAGLQLFGWLAVLLFIVWPGSRPGAQVLFWACAGAVVYLVFLAYYQRMVEARYALPTLPLVLMVMAHWINRAPRWAKRSRNQIGNRVGKGDKNT